MYLPASHALQSLDDFEGASMDSLMAKPAAQEVHEEDPSTSAYRPAAQALHVSALVCFDPRLLFPKGHF
jgi:hypothetical protein